MARSQYRITITEHKIRTPGDANWKYTVRDMKAPKDHRIIVLGCQITAIAAISAAANAVSNHHRYKAIARGTDGMVAAVRDALE